MERDNDKRVAMYKDIQTVHRETSPFILIFQQARETGLRSNVQNFYTGGATDLGVSYWLATK